MQRRRFTTEFKSKVVQEAQEMGSAVQVAKRYEITANLIYR
ncbi:helix-turn-helix domain-containing protein, partial [Baia soyae]